MYITAPIAMHIAHDYISYPRFDIGSLEHIIIGPSPNQKEQRRHYSAASKSVFLNLAMIAKTFAKVTTVFDSDGNPTIQWGREVGDPELF